MIKRVAQIVSNNKLNSNKISFLWYDREENEERGLFPELGYIPDNTRSWRNKKQKINKIVKMTLKSLKDKALLKVSKNTEKTIQKIQLSQLWATKFFTDYENEM